MSSYSSLGRNLLLGEFEIVAWHGGKLVAYFADSFTRTEFGECSRGNGMITRIERCQIGMDSVDTRAPSVVGFC